MIFFHEFIWNKSFILKKKGFVYTFKEKKLSKLKFFGKSAKKYKDHFHKEKKNKTQKFNFS